MPNHLDLFGFFSILKSFNNAFFTIIIWSSVFLNSCKDRINQPKCPQFEIEPISPYNNPICNPSGKVIGFNYIPIKEIKYDYGFDCPNQATYIYDYTKSGFWLMDSDGKNQRRALPFNLYAPQWSSDGRWITFSNGNIFKMPFDGECFDTTAIIQLTYSGRDNYSAWSPKGNYIAYDNTDCGSAVDPIPPNSCGIIISDTLGNERSYIPRGRFPYWGAREDTVYYTMFYYDLINKQESMVFDNVKMQFTVEGQPSFNSQKNKIFFLGRFINSPSTIKLYSIEPSGENFKLVSNDPILSFSFTPYGKIVYLNFGDNRIDNEKGTLWEMDQDGSNKKQLTFNDFSVSF